MGSAMEAGHRASAEEIELSGLMRLTQRGDKIAYESLLLRLEKLLTGYVARSLARAGLNSRERTQDIIQEILLGIHSKKHTYDPKQHFLPWVFAIARYKTIDVMRFSAKRKDKAVFDDATEDPNAPEPGAAMDIEQLLSELPEQQRRVLGLVKLQGLSVEEASKKTGISPSNVKVSVHRAIKTIRKKLGERHENE